MDHSENVARWFFDHAPEELASRYQTLDDNALAREIQSEFGKWFNFAQSQANRVEIDALCLLARLRFLDGDFWISVANYVKQLDRSRGTGAR